MNSGSKAQYNTLARPVTWSPTEITGTFFSPWNCSRSLKDPSPHHQAERLVVVRGTTGSYLNYSQRSMHITTSRVRLLAHCNFLSLGRVSWVSLCIFVYLFKNRSLRRICGHRGEPLTSASVCQAVSTTFLPICNVFFIFSKKNIYLPIGSNYKNNLTSQNNRNKERADATGADMSPSAGPAGSTPAEPATPSLCRGPPGDAACLHPEGHRAPIVLQFVCVTWQRTCWMGHSLRLCVFLFLRHIAQACV